MAPATPTLPTTNLGKGLRALWHCVRHPGSTTRDIGRLLAAAYRDSVSEHSPITVRELAQLVPADTPVKLTDYRGRDGNVTLDELLAIAALVRHGEPRVLVEIGTFDGNTTLQMAANAPPDALVYTLDLPPETPTPGAVDPQDRAYIADASRHDRKYARSEHADNVTQWLGDSMTFDFAAALAGQQVDFAFVDGSHSYDYVRADTEKMLPLLAPGAWMLWHDYAPAWPGVIRWLDELSQRLPLCRIAGTALVAYRHG